MAWIEGTGPPDLPDIFQVLSINPEALDTVKQLNETLSFGNSPLGRVREEAIATVVAVANRCRFGALTHSGFLRQYTGDQQTAADMLVNHHRAGLDPADRLMLDFAVKVTLKPSTLNGDDINNLRGVGFDDQEILSIILVTCLVNFMNRLADSLGIDVPPSYQKAVEKWLTGPAGRQPWLMRPVSQRTENPSEAPLAGSLGPKGWDASPDWHEKDDESGNGLTDSPAGDRGIIDLDGAVGEKLPDLRLDGVENGASLGDLEDMLAGEEPTAPDGLDALKLDHPSDAVTGGTSDEMPDEMPGDAQQENPAEPDGPGRDLAAPQDTGSAGFAQGEGDKAELESQLGPPPPGPAAAPGENAVDQPPAAPEVTEYTITTTPMDTPESREGPEVEAGMDGAEEEEPGVLIDPDNPVARFVGENCVIQDGAVTSARDLYIAYLRWCDDNIEPPMPQRGFGMILSQMGFNRRRRGRGRNWSWWGVGLGSGDTGDEDENPDPDYPDDLEGED